MTITSSARAAPGARPRGAAGFYVVAAMSTGLSMNTSWRFAELVLHLPVVERIGMFAIIEAALIASGVAMRANVRQEGGGGPGAARVLAWGLCGLSAYTAVVLSGPVEGAARVLLGPVLGLICLHLALGIEIRARRSGTTGTWTRVGRELRERALSRLGLADDSRDALARTRDRAAARAARLATSRTLWRRRRLARAVRASGAATDPARRVGLVGQVAALRHLDDLITVNWPSPWRAGDGAGSSTNDAPAVERVDAAPEPAQRSTRPHAATGRRARQSAMLPLPERIAQIRRDHPAATQRQVAKAAGASVRTIARYWAATTPIPAGNGGPVPAEHVAEAHQAPGEPEPAAPNGGS